MLSKTKLEISLQILSIFYRQNKKYFILKDRLQVDFSYCAIAQHKRFMFAEFDVELVQSL